MDLAPTVCDDCPSKDEAMRGWLALFDNAPLSLVVADPAGRVLYANRYHCALVDTEMDALCAAEPGELVHPEDREATARALAGTAERAVRFFVARTRSGSGHWLPMIWYAWRHGEEVLAVGFEPAVFDSVTGSADLKLAMVQSAMEMARGAVNGG